MCDEAGGLSILFNQLSDAVSVMTSPQIALFFVHSILVLWLALSVSSSVVASLVLIPRAKRRSERFVADWPSVGVIVPCYMPNERDIIRDTVEKIASSIYSGELCIHVPFNGSSPEDEVELSDRVKDRAVSCYAVDSSTSKAENIRQALSKLPERVTVVVIFDADHHTTHNTIEQLVRALVNSSPRCVCVQGSVLPMRGEVDFALTWMKWAVIGMEYTSWRFYLPGIALLNGSAWFGGANAAWRRKDLEELGLSADAVTEDVEISIQAMLSNRQICVAPWAVVDELCPATLNIFVRQRLRWALGWEQVTFKHFLTVLKTRKRVTVVLLSRYINVAAGVLGLVNLVRQSLNFISEKKSPIAFPVMVLTSTAGYVGAVALLCSTMVAIADGESFFRLVQVIIFVAMAPLFPVWQLYTFMRAWATLLCCALTWIPTSRSKSATVHRLRMVEVEQPMPNRVKPTRLRAKHVRLVSV